MSRLYGWIRSNRGEDATKTGQDWIEGQINYGSRDDSRLAVKVKVDFPANSETPIVYLTLSRFVRVITETV